MPPTESVVPSNRSRLRDIGPWGIPLAALFAVWLWLVFSSGGFIARQWLPAGIALGLFGLVVSLLVAYPRRPRQLSLAVLGLFGAYTIWVALSALWADSKTRAWMESGRTLIYLLVFALAVIYLTDKSARRAFRYLLLTAAAVILGLCLWKLGSSQSLDGLFYHSRLFYPVSAPNHAAALFLVTFWPLMWLAAGPEEKAPVRGVALGLAVGLIGLAVLTQSRGAMWSLAVTLVFTFVVSPARLRTLLYLLVPAILMVYGFPRLNRYWLVSPQAVGGMVAVRTILSVVITAAFIGMILALLERWVKVSRRMKAIFGTIVLLGALGGVAYGSITWTRDAGGFTSWVSQTWNQFTGEDSEDPTAGATSRFTMVTSSGRVDIWRVAVQEIEAEPIVGIGADNFIFQYDRLRTTALFTPRHAHSFELQVLGETGIIGGVLAFGGILLTLVGMLWARFAAGWQAARANWQRRRSGSTATAAASPDPGRSRWGRTPMEYGWEMALLAGATYWLVHGSVDWMWQMPGVTIPAVLFAAAGIASIDARAEILWPRLNRRLTLRTPSEPAEPPPSASETQADPTPGDSLAEKDSLLLLPHRADQYAARIDRRRRRTARRLRSRELFRPPGVLSHMFRLELIVLSLAVLIFAALPYLSAVYQDSAVSIAGEDAARAAGRAASAHWWLPIDPSPYTTQASICRSAAERALTDDQPGRVGAVLDALALTVASRKQAVALEPADWTLHFYAGIATMDLLLASRYAGGGPIGTGFDLQTLTTGVGDWSSLADDEEPAPAPGEAPGSLAQDDASLTEARYYRGLPWQELEEDARSFLAEADRRNPLAEQVDTAIQVLEEIAGAPD